MTNVYTFPPKGDGLTSLEIAWQSCVRLEAAFEVGEASVDFRHPLLVGDWSVRAVLRQIEGQFKILLQRERTSLSIWQGKTITLKEGDHISVTEVEVLSDPRRLPDDEEACAKLTCNGNPFDQVMLSRPHRIALQVEMPGVLQHVGVVQRLKQRMSTIARPANPALFAATSHVSQLLDEQIRELVEAAEQTPGEYLRLTPEIIRGIADTAAAFAYRAGLLEDDAVKGADWLAGRQIRDSRRRGGQTTGGFSKAEAEERWQGRALEVATESRSADPTLGQKRLAKRIIETLTGEGCTRLPDLDHVQRVIAGWEQSGGLAKSSRNPASRQKGA